ncbi:hypothetical protein BKA70DRAFT_1279642 [Coprinopsis sp. MPI-PUGE-AT-0042]|nr:hypothetical protein BKA70DRAFT_1279642 [Coprinopsis sp. MPI-PUGE-AT-0042]
MRIHIFPTEVIDLVIDDLGEQLDISDPNFHSSPPYQTLLSTSLISRAHVKTSQRQIFSCLKIINLPCSPASLGKVQSIVARLDADPLLRQYVRDLWLQASSTYSTLFRNADEEDRTARQTHQCLAQLFQLLSASLANLTLQGPFNHIEFHRSLIQSIYHAKFSHLCGLSLHCLGTMPMSLIEHLPPSLKVVSLRGLGHLIGVDSVGKQSQVKPQLHSLIAISGIPGNMVVDVFCKKGFINNLVELKLQVFTREVFSYLQVFHSCQQTLQKVYLQFGTGPLSCTYAAESMAELNHHLEADTSITLPHVKSTTVEVQLHAGNDRIVDPDVHPVFLNTLIGRQPSLEELTILYWIYIPD